ncbi:MAG: hypothetical protein IPI64_02555 [Chloracidobacterium sp.]|nr:hypothetical protein [Chloracidobacterium sp.]
MHCPNCGKVVNKSLKYCKDCGERLSKAEEIDKDGTPGKMLDNILTTLFLVVMFGLGILVGLVAVLLGNDVKTEVVTTIVIAYLGAIFGICFMLARQVPKLIDARLKLNSQANDPEPHQLRPLTTAQLEEFREPVMSVTDHTTKTLDKVPFK